MFEKVVSRKLKIKMIKPYLKRGKTEPYVFPAGSGVKDYDRSGLLDEQRMFWKPHRSCNHRRYHTQYDEDS